MKTKQKSSGRILNRTSTGTESQVRQRLVEMMKPGLAKEATRELADTFGESYAKAFKEPNLLFEADELTSVSRRAKYGHPRENFERIADLWSAFLGHRILAEQVPCLMILIKVAREAHTHDRDNFVDIAGYARTREMLDARR